MSNENLTEKTLADVQAGIPARDAEIEALRKENAELREQLEEIGAGGVNGKLMPGAVSAEPVAYYLCTHENGKKLGTEHKETADELRDIGWIPEPLYRLSDPVADPVSSEPVQFMLEIRTLGNYGAAYDLPGARRAYTYDHQPGNVKASLIGHAFSIAAVTSSGDTIDRGLGLLKELQKRGFGVFEVESTHKEPDQ